MKELDYTQGVGSIAKQVTEEEYHKLVVTRARALAVATGATEKECVRFLKQEDYRRSYNAREDVKAKRAEYNRKRQAEMKAFRQLVRENPEVAKLVKGGE